MLNKQILIGRLGQDPEVRYTQNNTAVATLSVATTERFKDQSGQQQERTEWHKCIAWGRKAEVCQQYLKKGSLVYIEGPTQTNQWEDKNGQKRYTKEVKVIVMTMLDSKGATQENGASTGGKRATTETINSSDPTDVDTFEDDDLPF